MAQESKMDDGSPTEEALTKGMPAGRTSRGSDSLASRESGGRGSMIAAEEPKETDKERKAREAKEKKKKLEEFGGSVSVCKLLSMASCLELVVLFVGVLGAMAHGAGQPVLCLMFGELIDALALSVPDPNANPQAASTAGGMDFMDNLSSVAIKFSVIGCIVFVLGTIQGFVFPWFAAQQVKKMRPIYFDAILHRDVGWFDTHDTGALAAEMGSDMDTYLEGFGNKLGTSWMSLGGVGVGFGIGIYLEWRVGLMMTIALPVMGVGGALMGQAVMDQMTETQGAYIEASSIVSEVLFAIRTVIAFGGEQKELARYGAEIEVARKGGVMGRVKVGFGMGYIWMAYFSSMALAFWYGMTLVYGGSDLSVGNLMAAFFSVITAGFTIGQIPPGFAELYKCKTALARFFYIKDHEGVIMRRVRDERREVDPIESLKLENVTFAYPARPDTVVLTGLTLDIKKGQKVAVVGESGSGKSTVMALLERFYDPIDGKVLVNGQDLREFSIKSFRKKVGYVGQEPVLFATSVKANIMQGCPDATEAQLDSVMKRAQLSFVDKLPERRNSWVGSGGSQFSGGQKQRIAIARALLKEPSVLFLDEATSALDSKSEREIQETIDQLGTGSGRESKGLTIVSIAHRLSTVMNSDVIYVLQGGAVVEHGKHQDLIAKEGGLYQALAAAQGAAVQQEEQAELAEEVGNVRQVSHGQDDNAKIAVAAVKSKEMTEEDREKELAKTYKVPMSRLLSFCRPEWGFFVPGVIAALGSGSIFPLIGVFMLVDSMTAFTQGDREVMKSEVEVAAIWFVILGAIKWICTVVQFGSFGVMGEAITKRCRMAMLTAMFRQEIGFHDDPENTPGRMAKALQVYAFRVQVLCVSIGEQFDALCSVIVGVVLALVSCWEMALAMFLSIPVFAIANFIQMMVMMGSAATETTQLKNAQQVLSDAVLAARTVQAGVSEKDLLRLYSEILKTGPLLRELKGFFLGAIAFGFANGVMFWVCSAGFWFMGFLIERGRTDFVEGQRAFMGVLYAGLGAAMAMSLTGNAGKAKAAAHDMFELLDRKSKINGLEPDGVKPKTETQIGRFEFQKVNFFYPFRPDVQVLSDLSFTIEAGQSVGVCGPSGGGKSTVMSMIQRFYDPQNGSILIGQDRQKLSDCDIRWWRRQVGYVGQEPVLFDTTVLANVMYGLEASEEVSDQRLEECKEMAALNFLDSETAEGWQTQVGPRGGRLSGGQKQRVAICRALIRNPPVLLLDEATSALDTKSERKVQKAVEVARKGRTSFSIAHRLSTIRGCDVIIVVSKGRIVEQGSHSELIAKEGVYYKLQAHDQTKK